MGLESVRHGVKNISVESVHGGGVPPKSVNFIPWVSCASGNVSTDPNFFSRFVVINWHFQCLLNTRPISKHIKFRSHFLQKSADNGSICWRGGRLEDIDNPPIGGCPPWQNQACHWGLFLLQDYSPDVSVAEAGPKQMNSWLLVPKNRLIDVLVHPSKWALKLS